jgi:ferritin-like metal-binding protein YciE
MTINAMEDLLLQELNELYGAEQLILAALPKMAKAAHDDKLKSAFETHLKQTRDQVERLNRIYKLFGTEPKRGDCEPINEIVRQSEQFIDNKQADPAIRDASLIGAAQKVEHYEIALYGTAHSHAKLLGYTKAADLLADTLSEEEETDALLTQLATKRVNVRAARAPYSDARTGRRGVEASGGWGMGTLVSGMAIAAAVALLYAPQARGMRDRLGVQTGS